MTVSQLHPLAIFKLTNLLLGHRLALFLAKELPDLLGAHAAVGERHDVFPVGDAETGSLEVDRLLLIAPEDVHRHTAIVSSAATPPTSRKACGPTDSSRARVPARGGNETAPSLGAVHPNALSRSAIKPSTETLIE
jgi:hypothetical protein